MKPGAELLAAVEAAREAGMPVELIDRDINITLKRTWRTSGCGGDRRCCRRCSSAGEDDDEGRAGHRARPSRISRSRRRSRRCSTELGKAVPEIKGPLVDERDQYLASKMREAGEGKQTRGRGRRRGARAGHDARTSASRSIAPRSTSCRRRRCCGGSRSGRCRSRSSRLLVYLLAAQRRGELRQDDARVDHADLDRRRRSARCSPAARSSSVLSALVVAPIAAIYPLLGTGMVVGVVEAWRRKPSVADCERLPEDVQSVQGILAQSGDADPADRRRVGHRHARRVLDRRRLGRQRLS